MQQQGRQDLAPVLQYRGGKELRLPAGELPLLIVEDSVAALGPQVQAPHIGISADPGDDLLPFAEDFDRLDPVPEGGGLLKAQVFRRLFHLPHQLLGDGADLPLQQLYRHVNPPVVLLGSHDRAAEAVAATHVVVEAGPLLADIPWEAAAAGGQFQRGGNGIQGGAGLIPPAVGAEVFCSIRRRSADHGKAGIGLPGQPDKGVALVILEEDIVPGHVLLDEGVLQHQSLKLRADDDSLKVVHLTDHGLGLEVVAPVLLKVLAHPVLQFFCLTHIDHGAVFPVHQVYPRGQGQAVGLFQQFRLGHRVSPFV